eukprot:TRINITY_DN10644_c0_g1_i1.p2 TRINITY_DN10644_c0_g1~~TRINITY_DN10644_c0_g1_i1.p2  ORF type:complete len:267 (+),score=117.95 TRINITY_DN10644_c0_g1_i1:62-862(+)
MVGTVGALVGMQRGRRRAEERRRRRQQQLSGRVTPPARRDRRAQRQQNIVRRRMQLDTIMREFDTDRTGALDFEQLRSVMQQMNTNRGQPRDVSDAEVGWLLRRGDEKGTQQIERDELLKTVLWWDEFIDHRSKLQETLDKYDADRSGKIDETELRDLMQKWHRSIDPDADEEVPLEDAAALLKACDEDGCGALDILELCFAAHVYFAELTDDDVEPGKCPYDQRRRSSTPRAATPRAAHKAVSRPAQSKPPAAKPAKDGCSCAVQ